MIDEKKLIEKIEDWRESIESYYLTEDFVVDNSIIIDTLSKVLDTIGGQPKTGEWIPVTERLPEEYDSMFTTLKGTRHWNDAMFERRSNTVIATVEFDDGSRKTMPMWTIDGEWKVAVSAIKKKVIAWMPLPEPYEGE